MEKLEEVIERKFTDADTVIVDGKHFIDCEFSDTHLIYRSGPAPKFMNCKFTAGASLAVPDAIRDAFELGVRFASATQQLAEGTIAMVEYV